MDPASVCVDGQILPAPAAHLSVSDRGFQLGDGVFETLRAYGGRPIELAEHLDRLHQSLATMEIPAADDLDRRLASDIDRLLEANRLAGRAVDAAVRITISRGPTTSFGILPPTELQPTVVIQAWPLVAPPSGGLATGLRLIVSSIRRDPEHPLAAVKSTSRAELVAARLEARRESADDALLLTLDGYLSETTAANVFVVRDGVLATPDRRCAILPGTTRAWLLRWAPKVGLQPIEDFLTMRDLAEADEAFISSSVAGVLPVVRIDETDVGGGRPGPWTARARADREAWCRTEAADRRERSA